MGQILSNPVIDKELLSGQDALTAFGLCAMQGWRMSMEDSHIVDLNISLDENDHIAYYCVFDGHGGSSVAQFCGEQFSKILQKQPNFIKGKFHQALIDAFIATDQEMLDDSVLSNDHSGCTATTVLISKQKNILICANSGDSRTVLSCNRLSKALSFDHKPTLKSEQSRIIAADGFVEMDRVNGNLALSRAVGDFEFKSNPKLSPHEQIVTCVPDIVEHKINYDLDEFVVLACDGIWDCLTSQECVDLVHYGINCNMTLEQIGSRIVDVCCSPTTEGSGIGCDNMSIIIVALLKEGENELQWMERMRLKNYSPPRSFEEQRRQIFNFFNFSNDDDLLFDVSTKKTQDQNIDSRENKGIESPKDNNRRGPEFFSLEALLGSGSIQITQGDNNMSYIHGSALSEVLASLGESATSSLATKEDDGVVNEGDDDKIQEI